MSRELSQQNSGAFAKFKLRDSSLLTVAEAFAQTRVRRVVKRGLPARRIIIDSTILDAVDRLISDVSKASDEWIVGKTRLQGSEKVRQVRVSLIEKLDCIKQGWKKEGHQESSYSDSQETSTEASLEVGNESGGSRMVQSTCPQMSIRFLVS
jgi:hypothetical protein